jgi:hypothetical protein
MLRRIFLILLATIHLSAVWAAIEGIFFFVFLNEKFVDGFCLAELPVTIHPPTDADRGERDETIAKDDDNICRAEACVSRGTLCLYF